MNMRGVELKELSPEAELRLLESLICSDGWAYFVAKLQQIGEQDSSAVLNPIGEKGRTASENTLYHAGRLSAFQQAASWPSAYYAQVAAESKKTDEE